MDVEFEQPVNELIANLDISSCGFLIFIIGVVVMIGLVSSKKNMFEYFSLYDNIIDYCNSPSYTTCRDITTSSLKNKTLMSRDLKFYFAELDQMVQCMSLLKN